MNINNNTTNDNTTTTTPSISSVSTTSLTTSAAAATETRIHRIILFGDSLLNVPNKKYHLDHNILNRISNNYPHLNFELLITGIDGDKILDLKKRMFVDCIYCYPEAVIMYWSSDVADCQKSNYNKVNSEYEQNLIDVINNIKKVAKYYAIAGPNLQGEMPYGENKNDKCLDRYREMNRYITR